MSTDGGNGRVVGCGQPVTRYGALCTAHKSTKRRHGDAQQRAVTKAELAPYLRAVRARVARNRDSAAWPECDERWRAAVRRAEAVLAGVAQGRAGDAYTRRAAAEMVKMGAAVEPREAVETVFAVYLMEDAQPRRFASDAAFRAQLVRRVRALADTSTGTWVNTRTGKATRAYRELPPRTVAVLASWLVPLGAVGLHLAAMERRDREAREAEARDRDAVLEKALEELA